jgi:hypothetical protein
MMTKSFFRRFLRHAPTRRESIRTKGLSTLTTDDEDTGNDLDIFAINLANGEKTLLTDPARGDAGLNPNVAGWGADGTSFFLATTASLTSNDTDLGSKAERCSRA